MWSNNTWPSLKISDKTNTLYTGSTLAHMGRITYTSQYMSTHRRHTFISTDKCAQAVEQMAHLFTVDRKANLLLYLWFYACNSACGCENMWANVCVCVCVMKHGGQFGLVNEIDLIISWRWTGVYVVGGGGKTWRFAAAEGPPQNVVYKASILHNILYILYNISYIKISVFANAQSNIVFWSFISA